LARQLDKRDLDNRDYCGGTSSLETGLQGARERIRPAPSRSAGPNKIMLGSSGVAAEVMVTVPEP
jgi:hypothetical protein